MPETTRPLIRSGWKRVQGLGRVLWRAETRGTVPFRSLDGKKDSSKNAVDQAEATVFLPQRRLLVRPTLEICERQAPTTCSAGASTHSVYIRTSFQDSTGWVPGCPGALLSSHLSRARLLFAWHMGRSTQPNATTVWSRVRGQQHRPPKRHRARRPLRRCPSYLNQIPITPVLRSGWPPPGSRLPPTEPVHSA